MLLPWGGSVFRFGIKSMLGFPGATVLAWNSSSWKRGSLSQVLVLAFSVPRGDTRARVQRGLFHRPLHGLGGLHAER